MKTLFLIVLVACAKPAGGPLSHTFDNTRIASVPLEQKQTVTQAQQQYDVAVLARSNARANYNASEIELDLAEYQADNAIVVSQLVAARQPEAKLSPASAETASAARKAAEAKVTFMEVRRAWLEKLAESALYAVYAAQSRLELERARVAQANRLTPADFQLGTFQSQADARGQAAKLAAEDTESARKTAEGKLNEWAEAEKAYLAASGVKGPLESLHFAAEWKVKEVAPSPTAETPPETTPAKPPEQPAEPIAPMTKP